ncbi:MAG: tetratricopeptide repeat protein [Candidatus Eisenbacteria bacterium]
MMPVRSLPVLLFLAVLLLPSCSRGPSFEERKASGKTAFREKRYADAVELLDGCAREDPRDFDVRYYLARSLEEAGQYALALNEWEHVLLLSPSFAEGYYRKGNVLAMSRRLEAAIGAWKRATEIDPTYSQAYLNQGMAYEDLELWDLAMASYLLAIQSDTTFTPAYLNLALLFERAGEQEKALEMFDESIRFDPEFTAPYLNRIQILIGLGRTEEAAARIRELLDREDLDPATGDSLAALLSRLEP